MEVDYDMHRDSCELTFTFEGKNEVNAVAVAEAMSGLATIITAISDSEGSDIEYRLAVRALEPGCLKIALLAFAETVKNLITPDGAEYASNLIELVQSCFSLKRFLKGKLPQSKKESEKYIEVENEEGAKARFPKGTSLYFKDQRIDRSITYIVNGANESAGVSGLSLESKMKKITIPRGEFDECATPIDMSEVDSQVIESKRLNEVLTIQQLSLQGDRKWLFKGDKVIPADVEDAEFVEKMQSGYYQVYSGMYIIADMDVFTRVGSNGIPDEKSCKYKITKVRFVSRKDTDSTIRLDGV